MACDYAPEAIKHYLPLRAEFRPARLDGLSDGYCYWRDRIEMIADRAREAIKIDHARVQELVRKGKEKLRKRKETRD